MKAKVLINCVVTAQLIRAFVSAYAKIRVSLDATHIHWMSIISTTIKLPLQWQIQRGFSGLTQTSLLSQYYFFFMGNFKKTCMEQELFFYKKTDVSPLFVVRNIKMSLNEISN